MDAHPVTSERRPPHHYQCEHCGRPFRCTTAQYAHEDGHTRQGMYPCENCGAEWPSKFAAAVCCEPDDDEE